MARASASFWSVKFEHRPPPSLSLLSLSRHPSSCPIPNSSDESSRSGLSQRPSPCAGIAIDGRPSRGGPRAHVAASKPLRGHCDNGVHIGRQRRVDQSQRPSPCAGIAIRERLAHHPPARAVAASKPLRGHCDERVRCHTSLVQRAFVAFDVHR